MNYVVYDYTSDVYEELEDYKSRIEKAVEYINNNTCKSSVIDYRYMDISDEEIDNLLNILNGKE